MAIGFFVAGIVSCAALPYFPFVLLFSPERRRQNAKGFLCTTALHNNPNDLANSYIPAQAESGYLFTCN